MALTLDMSTVVQSNDCRTLTFSDATGVYDVSDNPGGWGAPNAELSTIDGNTATLTLQITVTTSNGTETVYDAIDFYDYNGSTAPTIVDDLVFILTPDLLVSDGVAMGTDEDEFVDGWYEYTYSYTVGESTTSYDGIKIVDGNIRTSIYDCVYNIPDINTLDKGDKYDPHWYEVTYPIYLWSIYQGMIINPYSGRKNKVLNTMYTLEQLL